MITKICLVTGANSGIGKEIAAGLAVAGMHVIMVCRNAEKGRAAMLDIKAKSGNNSVDLLIADLSSQADIRALAQTVYARYARLDVLINNAGVVMTKKIFSKDGIEMTLATNHLGPFLLTNLLLDLLKTSAPSRIINISSAIHKWGKVDLQDLEFERRYYHFMRAYAQSKLMMNLTSFALAQKLQGTGVTINCIHPGAVKTHLGSENAKNIFVQSIDKMIKFFFLTPEAAAKFPVELAVSQTMEGVTGKYFVNGIAVPASSISYDTVLANKVWDISEKMTGLT